MANLFTNWDKNDAFDWFDREKKKVNQRQEECLSRIDALEREHQNGAIVPKHNAEVYNQMRITVKDETVKENQYLETKRQECIVIVEEHEALRQARDNGALTERELQVKCYDCIKRLENIQDEMKQRKRLDFEIEVNGRLRVTCKRTDYGYLDLMAFSMLYFQICFDQQSRELNRHRDGIVEKQSNVIDFLRNEKESELNKIDKNYDSTKKQSVRNYNVNITQIEDKYDSRISFVQAQASDELKKVDSQSKRMRELKETTDAFLKRINNISKNGNHGFLDSSFRASLNSEWESLQKQWDAVLAYRIPEAFDLKVGVSSDTLQVTCTSSSGPATFPKCKNNKRKKKKVPTATLR